MGATLKALGGASRRELQALAKELQLCRANAKSEMIVKHALQFLNDHPEDGEKQVLRMLGCCESSSPTTTKMISKEEIRNDNQPENEPKVEVAETKKCNADKKLESQKPPNDMVNPCKMVLSPTYTAKSSPTVASPTKSLKSRTKAPISSKKSQRSTLTTIARKSPPLFKEKVAAAPDELTTSTKAIPVSEKVINKARKAVEALVKSVPDLTFIGESRVRCCTTGHEMVADVNVIQMYIQGKRYKKALNLKASFAKYAPMFVDHPDESKTDMLWCNVTESAVARDEERVKHHIAARKYQKQLPIWKEQEAAKKKADEEEAQRRAARIEAGKKRRLEALARENIGDAKTMSKRKHTGDR
ncbi:hypothetical protein PsorP6_011607 [Peronosclerospora sorghi]|uniref:Uncharacterized protein n=1 Tax=Peronosclerospora sorghi TaxID=230839 RepID=A0ACC0WKK6_9STRA|nr:hypothetical protein PsorP6_011607 [Peronosclerospora sorghi]